MPPSNILLESGTNEVEIVVFYLTENTPSGPYTGYYGVNVAKVLEIIRKPSVTALPEAIHPSVLGAFNLRGRVIPLVDLSLWLDQDRCSGQDDKVVVTEFNGVVNAFLVTGVTRIHRLGWDEIEPPSPHVQRFSQNSIVGVVRLDNRVVFIIDMEQIVGELNPGASLKAIKENEFDTGGDDRVFRALIADDSTTIRQLLSGSLTQAGFCVTSTINGQAAWDTLQGYKAQAVAQNSSIRDFIDLVVSDIEMPAMDGHNLTKRIKTDPVLKDLPVILFSSLITDSLRHKGEAVGADEQISKPEMHLLATKARNLAGRASPPE
jgi:two-component system, chemotaxis family, chemotaxis protein CheV